MKKVLLSVIFLSACTMKPKITYVPVVAPCPIPSIPAPLHYPTKDLKTGYSPSMVAKAYVSSLNMCQGQNEEFRKKMEIIKDE